MQKTTTFKIVIIGEHFIGRNCLVKRIFEGIFSHQHPFSDHTGCEFNKYNKLIDRKLTDINIFSFFCGRRRFYQQRLF